MIGTESSIQLKDHPRANKGDARSRRIPSSNEGGSNPPTDNGSPSTIDPAEKYGALLNSLDEGFCIIEVLFDDRKNPVDYRFLEVNSTFEQQTGLKNAQGKRMRDLAPAHEEHWFQIYGNVALNGKTVRFQNRADALHRWFDVCAFRIGPPEARQVAILFADITERVEADARLRESEATFRAIAENIPQMSWMTNPDGWITWYNKRWFDYTGTTFEQMQGWGWQSVQHPEHIERVRAGWKHALESGHKWQDTFPLLGKDGHYRWFLSIAFPIRDAEGKIVRWFGTNTDITDLRNAQAALREREAILRAVATEAHVGLAMIDEQRRYVFANQTFGQIVGRPETEIVGKKVPDAVHTTIFQQLHPHLDRAFAGEHITFELRASSDAGHTRFYEVTYEPQLGSRGRFVVVVMVDVTDRKQAQETLKRTVDERTADLQETNAQLEAFTYTIAHDLRAPLRAQAGFAEALLQEFGDVLGDTGKTYAQRIRSAAQRLDALLLDLLGYARISRGDTKARTLNLRAQVMDVLEQLDYEPRKTEATTRVEPFDFCVVANQEILRTVLANLLTNAAKFHKPNVPPEITVRAEERGENIRLWIEDNGIGIRPDYHEQIFGVFKRLHQETEYPGTGVGLAIVQKGVERMGGQVGVESQEGAGSRFWVEIKKAND